VKKLLYLAVFAGGLVVASSASAQQAITCSTNAQSLTGDPGTEITVTCPAGCTSASVWGTGTYSDDSGVCTAAIHAGALTTAGGTVRVQIAAGLSSYPPSTANGVTTSSWGSWGRSFVFVSSSATPVTLACGQNAQSLTGGPGTAFLATCPAGCGSATVWGTNPYSDDSGMCTAAIHAGVITNAGGTFNLSITAGQSAYPASTANGVTTSTWGSWGRSFSVSAR
jgi:hypothetical protein